MLVQVFHPFCYGIVGVECSHHQMSLKASLMASLRASTSPIMGYGVGGGGGTNASATGTAGSITVGSPRDQSGAGL